MAAAAGRNSSVVLMLENYFWLRLYYQSLAEAQESEQFQRVLATATAVAETIEHNSDYDQDGDYEETEDWIVDADDMAALREALKEFRGGEDKA